MMAVPQAIGPGKPSRPAVGRMAVPALVAGVAIVLIVLAIWFLRSGDAPSLQRDRVVQEITVIPPPVPPVPEEKIMEEEPEIVEPVEEPRISEEPVEQPSDERNDTASDASSEAAGLDRPSDAGSDSFRLSAGKGGGLFGRGGGGGAGGIGWGTYVETHIQRALQRDARTRSAIGSVRVTVNIDPSGRFVGASLQSSTGDQKLDAAIREVLASLPPLGRSRPANQEGVTHATINMKRTAA